MAGMRWVDSNYDGKLTAADPVWNELKIWRDADGDGQAEAGETKTLSALGITALAYAMGRLVTRIDDRTVIEANRDGLEAVNESMYFCERMAA